MTSYFEIQGCPNRKQKKKTFKRQWRNSKEKERLKKSGRQMKRHIHIKTNRGLTEINRAN